MRRAAVKGRLQVKHATGGTLVIDDSYNANPDSVRAAIDVLAGFAAPRLLVLGDMGEVGDQGPAFHTEIGAYARAHGIESLWATGAARRMWPMRSRRTLERVTSTPQRSQITPR